MSTPNPRPSATPDLWSALADGEASATEAQAALAEWRPGSSAESTWHAYHLIGDTLRSSELAAPPRRDERLLVAVRERLAREPVVLMPSTTVTPVASASRRRWRTWSGSAAMAAGVGAVGVMVWLTQAPLGGDSAVAARTPQAPATLAANAPAGPQPVSLGSGAVTAPGGSASVGPMLRDARLDEYLAAHRQMGAGRPLGTPAGYVQPAPGASAR